jgi:opacity protein-like surface antigen
MKAFSLAIAAWLLGTAVAGAQEPPRVPLVRGDAHVVIGWQNLHREQPARQNCCNNDWVNNIFYGAAGAGWYWTDNLKTQVDFGGGTKARQYRYSYIASGTQSTNNSSELSVQQQSLAIGQQYQFFRNQWFHPHLGAGVDIARETTSEFFHPTFIYDSATRTSTQIAPPLPKGPEHRTIARPFVEAGLKAYLTKRAFFLGDSRIKFKSGIDEVLFRIGFGVDF